jgi:hypothetical protein
MKKTVLVMPMLAVVLSILPQLLISGATLEAIPNSHNPTAQIKALAQAETPIELPEDFQYPNGIAHANDGTL